MTDAPAELKLSEHDYKAEIEKLLTLSGQVVERETINTVCRMLRLNGHQAAADHIIDSWLWQAKP